MYHIRKIFILIVWLAAYLTACNNPSRQPAETEVTTCTEDHDHSHDHDHPHHSPQQESFTLEDDSSLQKTEHSKSELDHADSTAHHGHMHTSDGKHTQ